MTETPLTNTAYGGSGWRGIPPAERYCHAPDCGQKLTLKDTPLWFADHPWRVYHFQCALATLKSPGLDSVRRYVT